MATTYDIPTPPEGLAKWHVRTELPEGGFIRILYRWNDRDGAWYMSFANDAGESQIRARRVVIGTNILKPFKHREVPQGSLDVVDVTGEDKQPGREELGDRVKVRYTPLENAA